MNRVIRFLAPSLLMSCVAAREPITETSAHDAASCDEALPSFAQWDGQPLPPPVSEDNAVYLCFPNAWQVRAMAVDNHKIAAAVVLSAGQVGAFVAAQLHGNPMAAGLAVTDGVPSYGHFVISAAVCGGKGTTTDQTGKGVVALAYDATDGMSAVFHDTVLSYQSGNLCPAQIPKN